MRSKDSPHPPVVHPTRWVGWIAIALTLALTPASQVGAQVAVFHSPADDGGQPPATPTVPTTSLYTLNVYAVGTGSSSNTGTVCEDADGGEICAVDLVIGGTGGVRLSNFIPDSDVVFALDTQTDQLRLNQLEAISGWTGPVRLGSLEINTLAAPVGLGQVVMLAGVAIDAGLHSLDLAPSTLAVVPEPGTSSGIAVGLVLLGFFARTGRRPTTRMIRPKGLASHLLLGTALALGVSSDATIASAGFDQDGVPDQTDNCPVTWNAEQLDRDGDGRGDVCDNCPFAFNPGQEDVAGFASSEPDGIGDACQCGDFDDSGRVDIRDLVVSQRWLTSLGPSGVAGKCPTDAEFLCSSLGVQQTRQLLALRHRSSQTCAAEICENVATICAGEACPSNPVLEENRRPGNPPSEWDLAGIATDDSLSGFTNDISYAPGETVAFKITATVPYNLMIYRLGDYHGLGARRIAVLSQPTPTLQPTCQSTADPVDCGNWSTTETWTIPGGQVSGVYLGKVAPASGTGSQGSHILFVIRDDIRDSDILFQTGDTTWQAYNQYGGGSNSSFYNGASRVSYDRPFKVDTGDRKRTFFGAEYQMLRFLERNGYDVSYFTGVDMARRGSEVLDHKVFLSVGHDEYWSREMREALTAARDGGTNLMFLGGNLMFWKSRWEDGFRTQVSYKTSQEQRLADPGGFTATWRDVRFDAPGDVAEPENSILGLIFGSNDLGDLGRPIQVPEADGNMRLWRDTPAESAAACEVLSLAPNTVGFEFDTDQDNGFRPAGLIPLSTTGVSNAQTLIGAGTFTSGGTFSQESFANHRAALYRHANGALVFNAGTIQWSLGLGRNDLAGIYGGVLDPILTQATANMLQDMGALAAEPRDFCPSTRAPDLTPPTALLQSHNPGAFERIGSAVRLYGTASDVDGRVGGVEVSLDGGTTWHPTMGRENWHYDWTPEGNGSHSVLARAVDDSGNIEPGPVSTSIEIECEADGCSIWTPSESPAVANMPDSPVEVGVRFRSDVPGLLHGVHYWAAAANTGPHPVHLWSSTGTLLAAATGPVGSTSGWRTIAFASPIALLPNVTYTASVHTTTGYPYTNSGLADARYRQPLRALGGGGVFAYGATPTFPNVNSSTGRNYWVDVDFEPTGTGKRSLFHANPTPDEPNHFDGLASANAWGVELGVEFQSAVDGFVSAVRFYRADDSQSHVVNLWRVLPAGHPYTPANESGVLPEEGQILASGRTFAGMGTGWHTVPLSEPVRILAGESYVASYHTSARYAVDRDYFTIPVSDPPLIALNGRYRYGKTSFPEAMFEASNYWVDVVFEPTAPRTYSLWPEATVPSDPHNPDSEVEVGVRFVPEADGLIDGLRFYKHPSNNGAHTGTLWTGAGAELASAAFVSETSCGWQTQRFPTPIPVVAGNEYVMSYHTTTGYAVDRSNVRAQFPVWSPPLRAPTGGVGNGVYTYGPRAFPTSSFAGSNYWVDVLYRTSAVPAAEGPTRVQHHPLP